jgi:ERCC4-related helicase
VWCGLNDEADEIARTVEGAVNVEGSWSPDAKAEAIEAFQDGAIRVLVTKTSIAGFGMNFQNCHQMAFVGLSDSWESYYQAIRRCWRFGQQHPVDVHIVVSDLERQIVDNVRSKEAEANASTAALVHHSPIRKENDNDIDRSSAVHHRRVPRRMLASTTRR